MKAITVRQPWASAIIWGGKNVENRSWPTDYRGPLVIHAAKKLSPSFEVEFCKSLGIDYAEAAALRGHVLGMVDLVDCVELDHEKVRGNKWAKGHWCWILKNPRPLAPVACAGRLKLWDFALAEAAAV